MLVRMFNFWYFFWIVISVGAIVGLYFLLRNRSEKTKKIVLGSLLFLALLVHFLKLLIPPYSINETARLRDSWFINICGANIFFFPFLFLTKNKYIKDYMFYIGLLGGGLALLYPTEALNKTIENPYVLEVVRFYFHHLTLFAVPLLMVLLGLHRPSYKRVLSCPIGVLLLMLFIMLNQVLQSELGFVPLRDADFLGIGYQNTSFIWGPGEDALAKPFAFLCPKIFKTVPVGEFKGQEKYWPWFWIIVPVFVYLTIISFGLCMIFDFKNFKNDFIKFKNKVFDYFKNLKGKNNKLD